MYDAPAAVLVDQAEGGGDGGEVVEELEELGLLELGEHGATVWALDVELEPAIGLGLEADSGSAVGALEQGECHRS